MTLHRELHADIRCEADRQAGVLAWAYTLTAGSRQYHIPNQKQRSGYPNPAQPPALAGKYKMSQLQSDLLQYQRCLGHDKIGKSEASLAFPVLSTPCTNFLLHDSRV